LFKEEEAKMKIHGDLDKLAELKRDLEAKKAQKDKAEIAEAKKLKEDVSGSAKTIGKKVSKGLDNLFGV
jgi:ribosomal protein L9